MAENNNEFKDSFLTTKEKSHMQTSYTQIKEHLKCEELVPCLHEKSIISQTEKQNIEAKETNDKKAQYILDNVFMKATYGELKKIRSILIRSRSANHIQVATLLPHRGEDIDWKEGWDEGSLSRTPSEPITIATPVDEQPGNLMFSSQFTTDQNSSGGSFNSPDVVRRNSDQTGAFNSPGGCFGVEQRRKHASGGFGSASQLQPGDGFGSPKHFPVREMTDSPNPDAMTGTSVGNPFEESLLSEADQGMRLVSIQGGATYNHNYSHSPQTQDRPQFTVGSTNSNQSPSGRRQSVDINYRPAGFGKQLTSCFGSPGSKSTLKHSDTYPQISNLHESNIPPDSYNPPQLKSKLLPYGIKPTSIDKAHGNGMCVVITNFTGEEELPGYLCDSADICKFFREDLGWEHVYEGSMPSLEDEDQSLRNLCKSQFTEALCVIRQTLQLNGGKLDRFFLFILSHGDHDGIMTLKEGSDTEKEEDENGLPVRMKIQDIADMFTHEKVGKLKGFPKVIFNQSCQGSEPLKSATYPTSYPAEDNSVPIHPDPPVWQPPEAGRAVGADVVVCEATGKNTMSWVGPSGSVFIQKTLSVWRELHETEHFLDMMGEVNRLISDSKRQGVHPHKKGQLIPAVQMSCVHSTLTHKYYLSIPQHLQQKVLQ